MAARSSTSYRAKWNAGNTSVIRVPEVLVEAVLMHAKWLDEDLYGDGKHQTLVPAEPPAPPPDRLRPVNVASVAQRSPFRYPGGKTWLIPFLRGWARSLEPNPSLFVEPFAGGAIASLTSVFELWADHAVLAESDERVAAVWRTVLCGQAEWLANRITEFDLTKNNVVALLEKEDDGEKLTLRDKAFLAILRNRVQRGGIMAPGAGLVKNGENNKGIRSRWYPETLARRIRDIGEIRHQLTFYQGDGFDLIEDYIEDESVAFYVDPPYTKAAKRLYRHWQVDHRQLFKIMCRAKGNVLMSYDNSPEIRKLARDCGFDYRTVAMKNTHHAKKTELLIGRSFKWLDETDATSC